MPRPRFTLHQLAAECDREAEMRKQVYARQVRAGTLAPALARARLDMMVEAAQRLRELNEHLYPSADQAGLFDTP